MPVERLPKGNRLLLTGVVLAVLGLVAMVSPSVAGNAVVYIIGGLLLVTGLIQLFTGWREESTTSKLTNVIQGAIVGVAGGAVLAHPFYGLAALSLVLAIFFLVAGIWKIATSFTYRPAAGWLALLASGALDFVLGWMIWRQWPMSGLWAIGILVGVDLLSTGLALIALAFTWKKVVRAVSETTDVIKERIAKRTS